MNQFDLITSSLARYEEPLTLLSRLICLLCRNIQFLQMNLFFATTGYIPLGPCASRSSKAHQDLQPQQNTQHPESSTSLVAIARKVD